MAEAGGRIGFPGPEVFHADDAAHRGGGGQGDEGGDVGFAVLDGFAAFIMAKGAATVADEISLRIHDLIFGH